MRSNQYFCKYYLESYVQYWKYYGGVMATNNSINSQTPVPYASILSSIDLTTTGATKIFTTLAGITFFLCTSVIVQIITSNTFATPASISVGTNGASYN